MAMYGGRGMQMETASFLLSDSSKHGRPRNAESVQVRGA
jgi:hypothetical protein